MSDWVRERYLNHHDRTAATALEQQLADNLKLQAQVEQLSREVAQFTRAVRAVGAAVRDSAQEYEQRITEEYMQSEMNRASVAATERTASVCADIAYWYENGGKAERGIRTHFGLDGYTFENESQALLDWLNAGARRSVDDHPTVMQSLLLVGLTAHEFELFRKHRVPYSGSTGPCNAALYPGIGPYIATFVEQLLPSMDALGWTQVVVEWKNGNVRCRKLKLADAEVAAPLQAEVKRLKELLDTKQSAWRDSLATVLRNPAELDLIWEPPHLEIRHALIPVAELVSEAAILRVEVERLKGDIARFAKALGAVAALATELLEAGR